MTLHFALMLFFDERAHRWILSSESAKPDICHVDASDLRFVAAHRFRQRSPQVTDRESMHSKAFARQGQRRNPEHLFEKEAFRWRRREEWGVPQLHSCAKGARRASCLGRTVSFSKVNHERLVPGHRYPPLDCAHILHQVSHIAILLSPLCAMP